MTYLVQRMASIQALFFITSIAFYALGRRRQIQGGNLGKVFPFYVACSIAAVGAFLSKENSLMLPVMIVVTEVWFFTPDLHRYIGKRLVTSRKLVRVVLLILLLCLVFLAVKMLQDLTVGYAGRHFTMVERLLTETRIVVWYISLLLWPAPSRMSIEHDVVVSTSLINPPTTLLAAAFSSLLGWLTIRYRKKYPLITYGLVWFFLNLLIESSIVPLELIFEHRLYLPSVGFSLSFTCALVGALQFFLARKNDEGFQDHYLLCLCHVGVRTELLTFSRNEAWRNNITIHLDAVLKAPTIRELMRTSQWLMARPASMMRAISEAESAIALGAGTS